MYISRDENKHRLQTNMSLHHVPCCPAHFVTTYLDILFSEFLLFVVEESVVDDHRQLSRDLGAGRVVTRAVAPGVLAAAGGCLGDDEDLTQHPVIKFII